MRRTALVLLSVAALAHSGCKYFGFLGISDPAAKKAAANAPQPKQQPIVRSFTDTQAVTAIAGGPNVMWVGTARGLVRWDTDKSQSKLITAADGLPGNSIRSVTLDATGAPWVVTAGGVSHFDKGAWKNLPAPPVGEPISSMAVTSDGTPWVSGPTGLARLNKKGSWDKLLPGAAITVIVTAGQGVWAGTKETGLLHVTTDKTGDKVDAYGPEQGCDVLKVSGMTATPNGVMAVGEGKGGQRVAFFDGFRFFSYKIDGQGAQKIEWVRRIGNDALFGAGAQMYAIKRSDTPSVTAPMRLTSTSVSATKPPMSGSARVEPPAVALEVAPPPPPLAPVTPPPGTPPAAGGPAAATTPAPTGSTPVPGAATAAPGAPAPALVAAPTPEPAKGAQAAGKGKGGKTEKGAKGGKGVKTAAAPPPPPPPAPTLPPEPAPGWEIAAYGPKLPPDVSAVGPDGPTLFVGTRYLGAARVDLDALVSYRQFDLADGADKLSVACDTDRECWAATGIARAWHYDGNGFEAADIDPEANSKVMVVLNPPNGSPIALSRGAADKDIRVSQQVGGKWVPVILRDLGVPVGIPEITFATFAPSKRLWLGLRYIDKDGDAADWGAVEVDLNKNVTLYHRRVGVMSAKDPNVGFQLPNDVTAAWFTSDSVWFGTRTGAARWLAGNVSVFTEADGMGTDMVKDIVEGADGNIWVATNKGVGSFDVKKKKWVFANEGDVLKLRASSMLRDKFGWTWVGSPSGIILCSPPPENSEEKFTLQRFDDKRGLIDNNIVDLTTDKFGRVWVLTEKGISIVER